MEKLLTKLNGRKSQLSSENRKCRLELDDNVKKFLKEHQCAIGAGLGYLAGLAVLALFGAVSGVWVIFHLFLIPLIIVGVVGAVLGVIVLAWAAGDLIKDVIYGKLGIETECHDNPFYCDRE